VRSGLTSSTFPLGLASRLQSCLVAQRSTVTRRCGSGAGIDRYAAAALLVQLYVGRHAFEGQALSLVRIRTSATMIDPQGSSRSSGGRFTQLQRAGSHQPLPMRAELLKALGAKVTHLDASAVAGAGHRRTMQATPLSATSLSGPQWRPYAGQVSHAQGDLRCHDRRAGRQHQRLGQQEAQRSARVPRGATRPRRQASGRPDRATRHLGAARGRQTEIHRLALAPGLTDALMQAGHRNRRSLAEATRESLTAIPKVGAGRVAQVVGGAAEVR